MNYREEMKMVRWTFWRVLGMTVIAAVVLGGVGFALHSVGLFGHTVVERKVFENSYQRTEALKAQIANDEAALAEIESKLANPNLDENVRYNLKAQASAMRLRIQAAKRRLGQ